MKFETLSSQRPPKSNTCTRCFFSVETRAGGSRDFGGESGLGKSAVIDISSGAPDFITSAAAKFGGMCTQTIGLYKTMCSFYNPEIIICGLLAHEPSVNEKMRYLVPIRVVFSTLGRGVYV